MSTLCGADQIEPLRFRIDPANVERLLRMVNRASFEVSLLLSRVDLSRLEEIVDAGGRTPYAATRRACRRWNRTTAGN